MNVRGWAGNTALQREETGPGSSLGGLYSLSRTYRYMTAIES